LGVLLHFRRGKTRGLQDAEQFPQSANIVRSDIDAMDPAEAKWNVAVAVQHRNYDLMFLQSE